MAGADDPNAPLDRPPAGASKLETALWLLRHEGDEGLNAQYRELLIELLPLLEEAETSLGLGLKDAIGQLKVKLG